VFENSVVARALVATMMVASGDEMTGYRYDQVERISLKATGPLPTPGPFTPALAAALDRRDAFAYGERRARGDLQRCR
jgi:hypothetical protein